MAEKKKFNVAQFWGEQGQGSQQSCSIVHMHGGNTCDKHQFCSAYLRTTGQSFTPGYSQKKALLAKKDTRKQPVDMRGFMR